MEKYNVSGMSCAACVARVEKAVSKVKGVQSCSVSLLTNSMGVEGNASAEDIISAVQKAGYDASLNNSGRSLNENNPNNSGSSGRNNSSCNAASSANANFDSEGRLEISLLKKRLISSVLFLVVLMYFSMGHMMWNFPVPAFFIGNHLGIAVLQLILCIIIMIINRKFFLNGFKSLLHFAPNMDTLVALGSGISFVYSLIVLFLMTASAGDSEKIMHYMNNLYFESAAMILTLITVGKLLEAFSKGKTTSALKSLINLSPQTACIIKDGKEVVIPISQIKKDDMFIVRAGENIPADGIIIEGSASINEAALTGESIPADKKEGDSVSAATTNLSGFIKCRAEKVGQDTMLAKIIQLVSDSSATKAPIAKVADKVSGVFVPVVLGISLITFLIWIISGADFSWSLERAISVLVVSCPCALGLATPVAIMVGNGVGARNGILFKTSAALETAGKINTVILDKTGTITKGEPSVTDIIPFSNDYNDDDLLKIAGQIEAKSSHPLAKAVIRKCEEKFGSEFIQDESLFKISDFKEVSGNGLKCTINGKTVCAGKKDFILNQLVLNDSDSKNKGNELNSFVFEAEKKLDELSSEGKTPLLFSVNDSLIGIIAVSDVIKEDSVNAVNLLKNMGIKVVMLTGDNKKTADVIGKKVGVNKVIAEVLPDEKQKVVRQFSSNGKVCMVGDGINDAPALVSADLGVAIGSGSDIAIDSAEVVVVKSRLSDVPALIRLGRHTLKNIYENLFWAFFYNIVLIPVAAGAYFKLLGLQMNPMFGAAAMSLSSFCVVTNALRLNFVKIKKEINCKETKMAENIKKIIKVDGMMCEHCEAHVKEALESIKGVESASADHKKGEVELELSKAVKDSALEKAVKKAGYTFIA